MAIATGNSPEARDVASVLHPYTNLKKHEETGPLVIARGEGVWVYDNAGNGYIEGLAGLWSTSLGFGEERLIEAAARQMRELPYYHGFASKSHLPMIDLAERLKELAPVPMSHVFFANSGSEATDTVVKLVWYYNNALGRPEKKKIISRMKAYHGVTVASASMTGLPYNHRDFDLPIKNIIHTDCPHHYHFAEPGESEEDFASRLAANLEKLILDEGPDTVAAMIGEPIMGAGGVIVPPATYWEKVQEVLRKYDVLLIADEVICGFCRTGNMFGSETFGLKPNMMTVAKALSSSYLPISAVLIDEKVYSAIRDNSDKIGTFGHGYTYSGHPVPAAVAIETLKIYEERDILGHVRSVAPRLQDGLRGFADHPLVGEVRGAGLIGALELVKDKATHENFDAAHGVGAYCMARAQHHGLLVRALPGDTLAFCPPLIVKEEEIDMIMERFAKALDDTAEMTSGL
ncbi:MAG: aspartate aminotransferase family protein [Rhodospirillales bacterium]|nr:MAG: aspartate aminotransferase family protein [Rhodospirillales bacterium]